MRKIFGFIKQHFSETGIFLGFFSGLFMLVCFIIFLPFVILDYLNERSKRWFGGDTDE